MPDCNYGGRRAQGRGRACFCRRNRWVAVVVVGFFVGVFIHPTLKYAPAVGYQACEQRKRLQRWWLQRAKDKYDDAKRRYNAVA